MPAETAANALSDPDKLAVVIAEDGQAAGFRDYGLRRMGGEGLQKILQYQLGQPQAAAALLHPDADREPLLRECLTGIFAQSKLLADVFRRARFLEPLPYYTGAGCPRSVCTWCRDHSGAQATGVIPKSRFTAFGITPVGFRLQSAEAAANQQEDGGPANPAHRR